MQDVNTRRNWVKIICELSRLHEFTSKICRNKYYLKKKNYPWKNTHFHELFEVLLFIIFL